MNSEKNSERVAKRIVIGPCEIWTFIRISGIVT